MVCDLCSKICTGINCDVHNKLKIKDLTVTPIYQHSLVYIRVIPNS